MEISKRLVKIFEKDQEGKRPYNGVKAAFDLDPNFSEYYQFHEYFNGDTGEGLGASHQTGWTGLVAKLVKQLSDYFQET